MRMSNRYGDVLIILFFIKPELKDSANTLHNIIIRIMNIRMTRNYHLHIKVF